MEKLKLYDVVALLEDVRSEGLTRGQVGTIVEEYAPGIFDIEFSDTQGKTYSIAILEASKLMRLRHEQTKAA